MLCIISFSHAALAPAASVNDGCEQHHTAVPAGALAHQSLPSAECALHTPLPQPIGYSHAAALLQCKHLGAHTKQTAQVREMGMHTDMWYVLVTKHAMLHVRPAHVQEMLMATADGVGNKQWC